MMVLTLIGTGMLASGAGGVKLINEADANGGSEMLKEGGNFPIFAFQNNIYLNNTGIDQKIKSVSLTSRPEIRTTSSSSCSKYPSGTSGECTPGHIVPTGHQCNIDCTYDTDTE